MKTLSDIKNIGEKIISFTITGSYHKFRLLVDEELDLSKADIIQIFEENLAKMLDNGFTNEEIYVNSGMYIPYSEELQELEEFNEFFHVDKGYIVGGLLLTFGGVHGWIY